MCDCGGQSIATTGTVHHFPTGLCQFLPQGGHFRALGVVHHDHMDVPTWYFSQPICVPSMRLVDLAVVTEMAVFTLDRSVCSS